MRANLAWSGASGPALLLGPAHHPRGAELKVAATERRLSPASTRATARSRKAIEYGRIIAAGLQPSQQLESELPTKEKSLSIHPSVIAL